MHSAHCFSYSEYFSVVGQSSGEVNPSDVWNSEEAWSSHHWGCKIGDKKSSSVSRDLPGSYSLRKTGLMTMPLLVMQSCLGSLGFNGGVSNTPDLITDSKNSCFQLILFNICSDRKQARGFPGLCKGWLFFICTALGLWLKFITILVKWKVSFVYYYKYHVYTILEMDVLYCANIGFREDCKWLKVQNFKVQHIWLIMRPVLWKLWASNSMSKM